MTRKKKTRSKVEHIDVAISYKYHFTEHKCPKCKAVFYEMKGNLGPAEVVKAESRAQRGKGKP